MKITEMTKNLLEYYMSILDKAVARFEKTDSETEQGCSTACGSKIQVHGTGTVAKGKRFLFRC